MSDGREKYLWMLSLPCMHTFCTSDTFSANRAQKSSQITINNTEASINMIELLLPRHTYARRCYGLAVPIGILVLMHDLLLLGCNLISLAVVAIILIASTIANEYYNCVYEEN